MGASLIPEALVELAHRLSPGDPDAVQNLRLAVGADTFAVLGAIAMRDGIPAAARYFQSLPRTLMRIGKHG